MSTPVHPVATPLPVANVCRGPHKLQLRHCVQVSVGYHTTEYGCLEFVPPDTGSSDNTPLIVGLAVGLGLLVVIVILVVLVVCCVVRSRRRRRKRGGLPMSNLRATDGHQYADVSNTAAPGAGTGGAAQGTTRSFMFGPEHLSDKPEESVVVSQY